MGNDNSAVMGNDTSWLGKVSVWSCIIGVVLPGGLLALFLFNERLLPLEVALGAIGPCYMLFVMLELVALGCGIAARNTTTGKIGMVISGLILLYPAVTLVLLVLEILGYLV